MEKKGNFVLWVLLVLVLCATFGGCSSAGNPQLNRRKQTLSASAVASASNRIGSSAVFSVRGNVYPDGVFYVNLTIGDPEKQYYLDIDTGSDLTWLQCDIPGARLTRAPHPFYRPNNNFIRCKDPICVAHHWPEKPRCQTEEQCDYDIDYVDHSSSMGLLVKDVFTLPFTDGSRPKPHLAFGCGYDQQVSPGAPLPPMDGVFGLGNGKSSIVSQLRNQGLIGKVMGHCISGQGVGFLFFGPDLVTSPDVVWTPMSHNSMDNHYMSGPAELIFGGQRTKARDLSVVFDSGSSYTYFNSLAYQEAVSLVRKSLTGTPLTEALNERALRVCWKDDTTPFRSISDVKKYFKPILLSFANRMKAKLEIPPEGYLIITSRGNVCLGILNGTEAKLDNRNVIGDISMQDKMVIYDNEKQKIGWINEDCDKLLKSKKILL